MDVIPIDKSWKIGDAMEGLVIVLILVCHEAGDFIKELEKRSSEILYEVMGLKWMKICLMGMLLDKRNEILVRLVDCMDVNLIDLMFWMDGFVSTMRRQVLMNEFNVLQATTQTILIILQNE